MEEQVPLTRREVVYEFMTLQVYKRFRHDQAARQGKQAPDPDLVLIDFRCCSRHRRACGSPREGRHKRQYT